MQIYGEKDVAEMEARTTEEDAKEGGGVDRSAHIEKETAPDPNDGSGGKVEKKYRKKIKFQCEGESIHTVFQIQGFKGLDHTGGGKLPNMIPIS